MIAAAFALTCEIESVYQGRRDDPEFAEVLERFRIESDAHLADLIEADGRLRLRLGRSVELERYLRAITDLSDRSDSLDAAIDMSLRWLARTGRADQKYVEQLVANHPQLESPIREAAILNNALWSTRTFRRELAERPVLQLPCDFGPSTETGESRYELRELLGEGAFGQVYLAVDRSLSEPDHPALVSVKVLPETDRSERSRERLIDEATKARRVQDPNVAQALDRGVTADGKDFIVYEYVDGGDLSRWARRRDVIDIRACVALTVKLARGVHAAHMAGLVHCDLKPNNILLTHEGEPKIADFGIAIRADDAARITFENEHGGVPFGNMAFMSPEQFRIEPGAFTIPTDLYALGGIFYWLITDKLPNGESIEEIRATHDEQNGRTASPSPRAVNPQLDPDLDAICRRSLAPRPEDRYSSAAAFAEDLESWLALRPIVWTRPSVARRASLWIRRRPALALTSVAAVLLLSIGVTLSIVALRAQALLNWEAGHREEWETQRTETLNRLSNLYVKGLTYDVLPQIWISEWLFGRKIYSDSFDPFTFWDLRLETAENLARTETIAGGELSLNALLWESSTGFWLLRDGNFAKAEPLLTANYQKWSKLLEPSDPWLDQILALRMCATVQRLQHAADTESAALTEADRSMLDNIAAHLIAVEAQQYEFALGAPMHRMMIVHLEVIYDHLLLNHPEQLAFYHARHEEILSPVAGHENWKHADHAASLSFIRDHR